jgi:hypothetical protein
MHRKWILFVLLPIAAVAIGATLYKWVDEKGVTHYSETPPAKQKAQEIRIQPPPSGAEDGKPTQAPPTPGAEGSTAPLPKTWQEKALEAQRRREAAEQQEEQERALAQEIALERKKRCLAAQQRLQALQADIPAYRIKQRGERVFVDDAKLAAEIASVKRDIQSYCEPSPR